MAWFSQRVAENAESKTLLSLGGVPVYYKSMKRNNLH